MKVAELEDEYSQISERLTEVEEEAMIKTGEESSDTKIHLGIVIIIIYFSCLKIEII